MDYFENTTEQSNIIEIWNVERGRKSDTYVSGWNIDDTLLKEHISTIKKKKGCNGGIKELTNETGKIKVVQLQGNLRDYLFEYIKQTGVDQTQIKIKL